MSNATNTNPLITEKNFTQTIKELEDKLDEKFGTLTTTVNNFMNGASKYLWQPSPITPPTFKHSFRTIAQEFQQSTPYHHIEFKYIISNLLFLIELIKLILHQTTIILLQENKLLSYKSTTYIMNGLSNYKIMYTTQTT
jgi:hypothetical protein